MYEHLPYNYREMRAKPRQCVGRMSMSVMGIG